MVQCLQLNRSWLGKPQPIFSAENVGEVTQICLWNRGALFPWTCQCHRRSIKTLHQVLTIRLKHRNKDGHFSVSQYFHYCWRGNTRGNKCNTNSENLTALCLGFFCLFGWLVLFCFVLAFGSYPCIKQAKNSWHFHIFTESQSKSPESENLVAKSNQIYVI